MVGIEINNIVVVTTLLGFSYLILLISTVNEINTVVGTNPLFALKNMNKFINKKEVSTSYHQCAAEERDCSDAPPCVGRFEENWPLLNRGYSFCMSPLAFCSSVKDWVIVDTCKFCMRPFHREESKPQLAEYCGRHRYMIPQNGEISPVWIMYVWMLPILLICVFSPFVLDCFISIIFVLSLHIGILINISFVRRLIKCFTRQPVMEEQFGMRLPSFITPDFIAREATLLLALKTSICSSSDKKGVVAALVSYAQAHTQKSLLHHFMSMMKGDVDFDIQAAISEHVDMMHEQSGETEASWLESIKEALNNWKRYRNNANVSNALRLLNYAVSVGLCEASSLTFKIKNLVLFEPMVTKSQLRCSDLADLVVTTVLGFVEGGWRVYETGNVSAFFASETDMQDFEDSYNRIRELHGFALTGNLKEHASIVESDYEVMLDEIIEKGDRLVKKISKGMTIEKKFVMDRLDRMRDWRNEFIQIRTRGGLRKSPFAISLFGNTGVGKSVLNKLTYEAIGTYNGIDISDERVSTWADNDKYASNIRSSTNVIIFDDFGNTSPKFMDFSPVYRLIQTINNALFLAPMADVFMKGKVALHPWIVMVTTNVEHLLAEQYSEKPESVLRRLFHVTVEVRPEFKTDGKLDSQKVKAKYGLRKCSDIWILTVKACVVGGPKTTGSNKNKYELKPIKFENKMMENVDVYTYLRWAQLASKEHYADQAALVSAMMKTDNLSVCEKCNVCYCPCMKEVEVPNALPREVDPSVLSDVRGEVLDEQSGTTLKYVLKKILWDLFIYISCFCLSFMYQLFKHTPENRRRVLLFYGIDIDGIKHYLMTQLWFFARWQMQQRWNIRAFFWRLRHTRTNDLINLENWYNSAWFDWIAWVPESVVTNPCTTYFILYFRRYEILNQKWKLLSLYAWCILVSGYWFFTGSYIRAFVTFYSVVIVLATILYYEKCSVQEELLRRNRTLPSYIDVFRRNASRLLLGATCFSLFFFVKWLYQMKKTFTPQGNLNPQNMNDIKERDAEPNMWATHYISPLPMSTASKTTTSHDLSNSCTENLVYVESDKYFIRGFLIESNFMILPKHFVKKHWDEGNDDFAVRCWRRNPNVTGGNFPETIARAYTYEVPNTDFVICWTPSAGSMTDLKKFLPRDKVTSTEATFILKDKSAEIEFVKTFYDHAPSGIHHYSMRDIPGGTYKLNFKTENGMCMSPLVSRGRGSLIIGFHLCGSGNVGGCGTLTFDQVDQGIINLSQRPGVVRTASMGTFPKEQFGTKLVEEGEVHHKSATRFLSPKCSVEVYGPTSGRATPHSTVQDTIISPYVEEVTGVEQKWGPPRMKGEGVYPYQVALEQLTHPSRSLGSVLTKSVQCYRMQFIKIYSKIPDIFKSSPLTQVQTVSGVAGKRFIDAMNFNTSPGWPLSGKKTKLLIDLEPEDYPDVGKPRTFVPEIWDEVERTKEILLKGERPYFVWKACLKDEPTKKTSSKVRVFQSAPIALQLLIRMYFLPIVRIIQLNPLMTECMVGANAEGPEWDQLNEHMVSKGKNILAGDYSKYDQRMPAQLTTAAFSVLIWIAENLCEYSAEDIKIMKALVAEVVYPLMAYNGDLLMLFGSNPSGQNLTVIINSIANSLLLRCCFYTIYHDTVGAFTKYCAFGTYGDDVKGSVSDERCEFNHIAFAKYLAEHDMKFTMPDKESVATEFMDADDADFLKRHNFYHPDVKANVGVLAEDSIFKRLHAHLESKELTLEQQSAQNIDTSLHDWFYYGRDKFETRLSEMKEIATRAGITHLCRSFDKTYDDRVQDWLRKYRPEDAESIEEDDSEITFQEN